MWHLGPDSPYGAHKRYEQCEETYLIAMVLFMIFSSLLFIFLAKLVAVRLTDALYNTKLQTIRSGLRGFSSRTSPTPCQGKVPSKRVLFPDVGIRVHLSIIAVAASGFELSLSRSRLSCPDPFVSSCWRRDTYDGPKAITLLRTGHRIGNYRSINFDPCMSCEGACPDANVHYRTRAGASQ